MVWEIMVCRWFGVVIQALSTYSDSDIISVQLQHDERKQLKNQSQFQVTMHLKPFSWWGSPDTGFTYCVHRLKKGLYMTDKLKHHPCILSHQSLEWRRVNFLWSNAVCIPFFFGQIDGCNRPKLNLTSRTKHTFFKQSCKSTCKAELFAPELTLIKGTFLATVCFWITRWKVHIWKLKNDGIQKESTLLGAPHFKVRCLVCLSETGVPDPGKLSRQKNLNLWAKFMTTWRSDLRFSNP